MGEVRFFRAVQGGREWVFAYLDGPDAVWGMDRLSGEEWWYEPSVTGWLAPMIRSRLASGVPIPEVGAPEAGTTYIPAVAGRFDLALHEPGHAVLAAFQDRLVVTGGAPPRPGMPDELTDLARAYVGELEVSSALDQVGSRWRVLHSVPGGAAGTGVDHVAIGPAGIFTIMSRNERGAVVNVSGDTVVAGGRPQPWVPESRAAAQRTQEALSAHVDLAMSVFPTIAVVGARLSVSHAPDYVSLVETGSLLDWLGSLPPRLSQAQVVQAYDVLRWSDAWTAAAPAPSVPDSTRALALERGLGLRHVPSTPPVPGPPPVPQPSLAPAPIAAAPAPAAAAATDPPADDASAPPATDRGRRRARTGPSGGRRSRPAGPAPRGSRGRTIAAVVASLMLLL
ncbi:MAG: nuclease-related domain-containing protein, partial [Candidatus Nanopelagicales bacterium]